MRTVEQIGALLAAGEYELTSHALRRMVERNIPDAWLREIGRGLELVEDYPDDKYSPSCLLLGSTSGARLLHVQVSRAETRRARIITVYEPDPDEWADEGRRRKRTDER